MNKQPFTELDTGWLALNGDFYPCDYMEHLATADELIGEWVAHPEETLLDMGWCEIHCVTFKDHGFLFNFKRHLTNEQIHTIRPVVEDNWNRIIKTNKWELQDEFER